MRTKVGGGGRDKEGCRVTTVKFICLSRTTTNYASVTFLVFEDSLILKNRIRLSLH